MRGGKRVIKYIFTRNFASVTRADENYKPIGIAKRSI